MDTTEQQQELPSKVATVTERSLQRVQVVLEEETASSFTASGMSTQQATTYLFNGFRVLGVNMLHQHKIPYVLYSIVLNGLVTVFLPLAFALSYMKMSGADLEISNLLTSLQVAINVWGCAIKLVIMAFMLRKLRAAEPIMAQLDQRCRTPAERAELRRIVRLGNRLVVLFACAYWSYSTSTFIAAVVQGRPPYALYLPFIDWRRSRVEFVSASLIEFALIDIACFQQVVDDSYAVIYVCILRTHMRILLMRVSRLGSKRSMSCAAHFEELKLCIRDHKNLLELYDIIAPVISITIFIQFMITATLLGAALINILLFASDFSTRVASCFYILAVVVEIFPLCYYAQCLIDESNRLPFTIFHSEWIAQDARYRKMLIFFTQRSQRSIELSAGKLFPITLTSFLSIAKFSFSLYTLIKKMGIKEKLGLE